MLTHAMGAMLTRSMSMQKSRHFPSFSNQANQKPLTPVALNPAASSNSDDSILTTTNCFSDFNHAKLQFPPNVITGHPRCVNAFFDIVFNWPGKKDLRPKRQPTGINGEAHLPTRSSRGTSPPLVWNEKKNVKWKVAIPGEGTSTPIVWQDKVFVLSAMQTDTPATPPQQGPEQRTSPPPFEFRFDVICLDRETGKTQWKKTASQAAPFAGRHSTSTYGRRIGHDQWKTSVCVVRIVWDFLL